MLTKAQGWQKLSETITDDYTHPHYARTVELAENYKILITGEGADKLLHQFSPREEPDMFEQRCRLTQIITPAVCGMIMRPAWKIQGVLPIVQEMTYAPQNDPQERILNEMVNNFYGGVGVDGYITEKFTTLDYLDPNAWIIEKFTNVDNRFEKPTVYCTEIGAADAVDFEYANNVLQYLTVRRKIKYRLISDQRASIDGKRVKISEKDGRFYQIYQHNDEIQAEQLDSRMLSGNVKYGQLFEATENETRVIFESYIEPEATAEGVPYYVFTEGKELFRVTFYQPKTGYVPAFRVGHIPDAVTNGMTCVNPFHSAMPYLMKIVQAGSAFDLSQMLHIFPQKFQYYPSCTGHLGENNQFTPCTKGTTPDGHLCKKCHGTGFLVHTSAQDVIGLEMPTNPTEMLDLTKLIHYANLPVDTVKWIHEYLGDSIEGAIRAAFNSDIFIKTRFAETATQQNNDYESVYDSLRPIAAHRSKLWIFIVQTGAIYLSIGKNLVIAHKYGTNFKLETPSQIIEKIKAAKEANASDYVIAEWNRQLTESVLQDQPDKIKKAEVQERFNPFTGKTDETIQNFLMTGKVSERDEVFYINRTRIFKDLESQEADFYNLAYPKQLELVNVEIDALLLEIKERELTAQSALVNPFGDAAPLEAGDELGKLPLALQQLGLAATRADELGDTALSSQIRKKMKELTSSIGD